MAQATIGPVTDDQKIVRSAARIKRLRDSLAKAQRRGDQAKVDSINEEIARRKEALEAIRSALSVLDD